MAEEREDQLQCDQNYEHDENRLLLNELEMKPCKKPWRSDAPTAGRPTK